jgi:hypothetical protein
VLFMLCVLCVLCAVREGGITLPTTKRSSGYRWDSMTSHDYWVSACWVCVGCIGRVCMCASCVAHGMPRKVEAKEDGKQRETISWENIFERNNSWRWPAIS